MKTLYLCGVGNAEGIRLAIRVQEASHRWDRILLLDDDSARHGEVRVGLPVVGSFDALADADPDTDEAVNLVTRTCRGRAGARARIAGFGIPLVSLVHPGIDLLGVELAEEVTAYPMSSLGAESRVESSAVVLIGALVGHGAHVGAGCIIAPLAVINARVTLGEGVYVGSNATILPDLVIGDGATIAANSVVFSDVPAGATAMGVPASILSVDGIPGKDESGQGAAGKAAAGKGVAVAATGSSDAGGPAAVPDPCGGEPWRSDPEVEVELQAELRAVMGRVLGLEDVAPNGNFFDLGGNSLKALQLCEAVRVALGVSLQLVDIYRYPTMQALAGLLGGNSGPEDPGMRRAQQRAAMRRSRRR